MNVRRRGRHNGEAARGERGYVLVLATLTMSALIISAAFAVDFGSFYVRAARIQRAADAAAMAGVVWLPNNLTAAESAARNVAAKNGFSTGVTVTPVPGVSRRLKVTINDANVPRYFSGSFTSGPMSITRSAIAEYAPSLALGSPDSRLGNDPVSVPPLVENLWASISAPYTALVNGDPFSTKCASGSGTGCTLGNAEYRTTGYKYAINVPASAIGQTLTVAVYDAGNYARPSYANVETADNGTVNTSFELFNINPDPLNASADTASALSLNGLCATPTPGKFYIANGADSLIYKNQWVDLCSVVLTQAGAFHLQVKSSSLTTASGTPVADSGNGWNQFSLKTTLSGTGSMAAISGVDDFSIFNNLPGLSGNISATFYFAEIQSVYAGRRVQARLFDPGDGQSGDYFVNFVRPDGTSTGCKYGVLGGSLTTISPCRIQTRVASSGANVYNGQWLQIDVDIPINYTCSADCWWKVRYDFVGVTAGNSPNDRTVWSASVVGNPVHLVE